MAVFGYWLLSYFAYIQAVQPWGQRWLFRWVSASFMFMPVVIGFPIVLVGTAFVKRHGKDVLLGLSLLGLFAVAFWGFPRVNWYFRSRAVARVARDASKVTNAVRAYVAAHGAPPASLEALVPRFLNEIPSTGMGAYPSFEYQVESLSPSGEAWSITVPTSLGVLNWDILLYLPSGQYPAYGYGGRLERFGEWAYVHE
jgi:hypothetical protein